MLYKNISLFTNLLKLLYNTFFSEFPGNWLSRNGAGAVPSNVDENDQSSDVDSSSTNKGPIPLGRPEECPTHFTELESPCQVLV